MHKCVSVLVVCPVSLAVSCGVSELSLVDKSSVAHVVSVLDRVYRSVFHSVVVYFSVMT